MPVVSQKEAAALWGLNPATVCRWAKPGGPLAPAKVGNKLDTDHPCVASFIAGRAALKPSGKAHQFPDAVVESAARQAAGQSSPTEDGYTHLAEVGDLTLREIAERYTGNPELTEYLRAWDLYEGARKKQLANDARRAELIERDLVRDAVLGFLADSHRAIGQAAKTIVHRCFELALPGSPVEDAERMAKAEITAAIRPAKERAVERLRDLLPVPAADE